MSTTFGQARDLYFQRAPLKSEHTLNAYRRALDLFLAFLGDHSTDNLLPIQQQHAVTPDDIPLTALSEQDIPILFRFAQWLYAPGSGRMGDHRPYKRATVELRLAGVQNWLEFAAENGWLPDSFQLEQAKRAVWDQLREQPSQDESPHVPETIEEVISYYDTLIPPPHLRKPEVDQERLYRWELTRLRNRALLHALAETGGRISEILSLNIDVFPEPSLIQREALRVVVLGKGGHTYHLRFFTSLLSIHDYLLKRDITGIAPLFVSHDLRYDGSRMSRIVAWCIVQRAARALGLSSITPQDFRHWRAMQLIHEGHSLDAVQDYLGHRSVETTRAYYASPPDDKTAE